MKYIVDFTPRARRDLRAQPSSIQDRILAAATALANNPRPAGCRKMQGQDAWRIRVGDYRIIYEIHDDTLLVIIIRVGHRSDVYR